MPIKINLKEIKLVVSDLDGTLLNSDGVLHPYTKEIIAKLGDFGILFTLASGRNMPGIRAYAEELKVKIPLILANGCIIQSLNGQIHHRSSIPEAITRKVLAITDREGNDVIAFVDDRMYYKQRSANIESVLGKLKDGIIEVGSWQQAEEIIPNVNKLMIVDWEDVARLDYLEHIFAVELNHQADYLRNNLHHLDIMPKGVSKATGLAALAQELGIQMHEVLAFGDFDNDAEMLAQAGVGVAVANASEQAKSRADLIIGSCAENGPAMFLEKLYAGYRP